MLYPKGQYWGPLVRIGTGKKDNEKKTPYLFIEFKVQTPWHGIDDEHPNGWGEDLPEQEQELRTIWIYLSDEALQYSMPQLEKIGFNGDFANPAIKPPVQWGDGVIAECDHNTYNGKTTDKWSLAGSRTGMSHEPMSADDIRRFNALWNSSKGTKKAGGPPSAPKVTGAPVAAGATQEEPWNK